MRETSGNPRRSGLSSGKAQSGLGLRRKQTRQAACEENSALSSRGECSRRRRLAPGAAPAPRGLTAPALPRRMAGRPPASAAPGTVLETQTRQAPRRVSTGVSTRSGGDSSANPSVGGRAAGSHTARTNVSPLRPAAALRHACNGLTGFRPVLKSQVPAPFLRLQRAPLTPARTWQASSPKCGGLNTSSA